MFDCQVLDDKRIVSISGDMTIYTAAELKDKLIESIEDPRELEINLAKVSEIDSAGVQLLILAQKYRVAEHYAMCLVELSNDVVNALETMGLISYFGESVATSDN